MTFAVNFKAEAFVRRRLVSGPIWLEVGGVSFPSFEWVDFPVLILGFWLTNIRSLTLGQSNMCECPFMDGPYQFNLSREKGQLGLTLVERRVAKDHVFLTTTVDPDLLLEQISNAGELVVEMCEGKAWVDNDLITLKTLVTTQQSFN